MLDKASRTSSSLNGLIIADTNFILFSYWQVIKKPILKPAFYV